MKTDHTGLGLLALILCLAALFLAVASVWSPPLAATVPHDLPRFREWVQVADFPTALARFRTVFWEPEDTPSLRRRIRLSGEVAGKRVLEIGTGTGLLALCCLQAGAREVVATDINPAAVENARLNARRLGYEQRLDIRHVTPQNPAAYAVLQPDERFDLIVSNPPWEDDHPHEIADYAFYDPGFELLRSLLAGISPRLNPGGRVWLAYGNVSAIRELQRTGHSLGLSVKLLDDRSLDQLPENFLPGMLVEVTLPGE